jgi:hypothetical protein
MIAGQPPPDALGARNFGLKLALNRSSTRIDYTAGQIPGSRGAARGLLTGSLPFPFVKEVPRAALRARAAAAPGTRVPFLHVGHHDLGEPDLCPAVGRYTSAPGSL